MTRRAEAKGQVHFPFMRGSDEGALPIADAALPALPHPPQQTTQTVSPPTPLSHSATSALRKFGAQDGNALFSLGTRDESLGVIRELTTREIAAGGRVLILVSEREGSSEIRDELVAAAVSEGAVHLVMGKRAATVAARAGDTCQVLIETSTRALSELSSKGFDPSAYSLVIVDDIDQARGRHAHMRLLEQLKEARDAAKQETFPRVAGLGPLLADSEGNFSRIRSLLGEAAVFPLTAPRPPQKEMPNSFPASPEIWVATKSLETGSRAFNDALRAQLEPTLRSAYKQGGEARAFTLRTRELLTSLFPRPATPDESSLPRLPVIKELLSLIEAAHAAEAVPEAQGRLSGALSSVHALREIRILAEYASTAGKVPLLLRVVSQRSNWYDADSGRPIAPEYLSRVAGNHFVSNAVRALAASTPFQRCLEFFDSVGDLRQVCGIVTGQTGMSESSPAEAAELLRQHLIAECIAARIDSHPKERFLLDLLAEQAEVIRQERMIVATRYRDHAEYLVARINAGDSGLRAVLHGGGARIDRSQKDANALAVESFRGGQAQVIVSTNATRLPSKLRAGYLTMYDVSPEPADKLRLKMRGAVVISLVTSETSDLDNARRTTKARRAVAAAVRTAAAK